MYLYLWTKLDRTYAHTNIKKNVSTIKIFMECCLIWSLISQRQWVSTLLLKTFLLSVMHWVVCLEKYHFLFWLVAAIFVYIYTDKMLWLYWLDGLEGPLNPPNGSKWKQFHGFGWFWVPTEEWNENASWKRKTRFKAKVNIYLKPCICLKSDNEGAADKNFLNFWNLAFQNEKIDGKWTDLPIQNIPPVIEKHPLWNQKYFGLP